MQLQPREKIFLGGGGALAVLLIFVWIFIAIQQATDDYDTKIDGKKMELAEVKNIAAELAAPMQTRESVPRNFRLMTYLEQSGNRANLSSENIERMNPAKPSDEGRYTKEEVEVRLGKLTLQQIVDYLYYIEKEKPLIIKRLQMKTRFDDPTLLDATFTVLFFRDKVEGGK